MNRKELIKEYKSTLRPMGIVQVKNKKNNRIYLAASANTPGTINSSASSSGWAHSGR